MISDQELIEKIQPSYRKILQQENLVLTREITANDVESWDSLNHILLIIECEQLFNIKFTANELVKLKNLGEFIDLIKTKI